MGTRPGDVLADQQRHPTATWQVRRVTWRPGATWASYRDLGVLPVTRSGHPGDDREGLQCDLAIRAVTRLGVLETIGLVSSATWLRHGRTWSSGRRRGSDGLETIAQIGRATWRGPGGSAAPPGDDMEEPGQPGGDAARPAWRRSAAPPGEGLADQQRHLATTRPARRPGHPGVDATWSIWQRPGDERATTGRCQRRYLEVRPTTQAANAQPGSLATPLMLMLPLPPMLPLTLSLPLPLMMSRPLSLMLPLMLPLSLVLPLMLPLMRPLSLMLVMPLPLSLMLPLMLPLMRPLSLLLSLMLMLLLPPSGAKASPRMTSRRRRCCRRCQAQKRRLRRLHAVARGGSATAASRCRRQTRGRRRVRLHAVARRGGAAGDEQRAVPQPEAYLRCPADRTGATPPREREFFPLS